jgi:hypothetical protein
MRCWAEAVIKKYKLVDEDKVAELKKEFLAGKNYLYNRLWLLIVLHRWMMKAGILEFGTGTVVIRNSLQF